MTPEEIKSLQDSKSAADAELAKLRGELDALKKPPIKDKEDDKDLRDKVRLDKEAADAKHAETRKMESALDFNLRLPDFSKTNKGLLPNDIEEIIAAAGKETYESAVQKSLAIKSSIVQSFFSQKENVDLLTASQKSTLDAFLKLTKNAKEERADSIYETIFEPSVETLRKIKKATELERSRLGIISGGGVENDYKERLIKKSRKAYLGE